MENKLKLTLVHAKYAIVFAQLIINNQQEGVHAFLVPIRLEDGSIAPNVRIEDMGYKMGCNGIPTLSLLTKRSR